MLHYSHSIKFLIKRVSVLLQHLSDDEVHVCTAHHECADDARQQPGPEVGPPVEVVRALANHNARCRMAPTNWPVWMFTQVHRPVGWVDQEHGAWEPGGLRVILVPKIASRNKSGMLC